MEKTGKPKSKLLNFLPRAASVVMFQNPPFSPNREKRSSDNQNKIKANAAKGFSGPIISIIPKEARKKVKNGSFESQEPTSPKVSCMGQIKHKQKIHKAKRVSPPRPPQEAEPKPQPIKKKPSTMKRLFSMKKSYGSTVDKPSVPERAPSLDQMKRFSSGRDAFSNFDWTAQSGPLDGRSYYSDEEIGDSDEEEREAQKEVIIPFSAPMKLGGGGGISLEPRKEVCLWKRRTIAPPRPLQLNMVR